MFQNYDLKNIVTPVNWKVFNGLLKEASYPDRDREFLINGFRYGFDLGYKCDTKVKIKAPNLKFRVGNETLLWNKVMKEVKLKRYAGPYEKIPYKSEYIQSPIGLVPKDDRKDVRLIFRWFKFTLKPPYRITHDKLRLVIWDTSF